MTMTPTTDPGARSKLPRLERRATILAGAAEIFGKRGFDATSLDDIAEAAAVSRALLYRHFDSKQAIYEAILTDTIHSLSGNEHVKLGAGFGDRLDNLIKVAATKPAGFLLVFRHATREPAFQAQVAQQNALRQRYIESNLKETIPDRRRRQFAAALMRDTIIGTLMTWIDCGQSEPERVHGILINLIECILTSVSDGGASSTKGEHHE